MKDSELDNIEKKRELTQYLFEMGALWSYKIDLDTILPDRELIEKSLIYLEFEEMYLIFDIFPYEKIRQVWIEDMVPCDHYYGVLNKLLAYLFFNVKNYKEFKEEVCGKKEVVKVPEVSTDITDKTVELIEKGFPFVSGFQFVKMHEGWKSSTLDMLYKLKDYISKKGIRDFTIRDMGEKFGHGDCRTNFFDATIHSIMQEWEVETYKTCCVCGKPATKYTNNWILPYCDECFPKDGKNI